MSVRDKIEEEGQSQQQGKEWIRLEFDNNGEKVVIRFTLQEYVYLGKVVINRIIRDFIGLRGSLFIFIGKTLARSNEAALELINALFDQEFGLGDEESLKEINAAFFTRLFRDKGERFVSEIREQIRKLAIKYNIKG
jgi:hypothetical protein